MRPDPPSKSTSPSQEKSDPPSPAGPPPAPTVRPKLQLQKRTVSEAETASPDSNKAETKPSPFGGARPIDTFAREKEIEERRQLALRQKKEQEDKAREEKRQASKAARAEKAGPTEDAKAKENGEASAPASTAASSSAATSAPAPVRSSTNFEVLSRVDGENGADVPGDEEKGEDEDEGENGELITDKEVKPREITQDIPTEKNKDAGEGSTGTTGTTSAEALEGDGWSTVSKTRNNRRGGHQAARAIAS